MKNSSDAIKKVKAAAAGRSKKPKDMKMQYIMWVGGTVAVIGLACVTLLLNPDRGPFQIPVNDQGMITLVNRNAKTWRAGASSFFEGWTVGDAKLLEGVGVSQMGGAVAACPAQAVDVPEHFDSREKWPQCFNSPIYNMGNCTASWAIATASALSNRFCVVNPTEYGELMLSPQQLLSCDTANRGCAGGDIDTAWNFVEQQGLVSEICFPYQADGTVSCGSKCSNEQPLKAASHCLLNGEEAIQKEVLTNGPVVAPLYLVDDFLVYRSGVYIEMPTATQLSDKRRQRIIHAVKIVGWGAEGSRKYWLIENQWGEDWGEHGYAKVLRGGEPEKREGVVIETFVLAAVPKIGKDTDPSDDTDSDFDADLDLDDPDFDDDLADSADKDDGKAADDDDDL